MLLYVAICFVFFRLSKTNEIYYFAKHNAISVGVLKESTNITVFIFNNVKRNMYRGKQKGTK